MINKLVEEIKKKNAPIVVGLDPMLNYVPQQIQKAAFEEYGETLEGAAEAIWQFNKGIVDATYDLIPAVKPQIAMYEQFGIPGMAAFKKTVDYCKEKGLIVISDQLLLHMQSVILEKYRLEVNPIMDLMKTLQRLIHIWEVTVSIRFWMFVRKKRKESLY